MKIKFYNIKWDIDGQDVDLPKEVVIEMEHKHLNLNDVNAISDEVDECGADELSDRFGWCVNSFQWEEVMYDHPSK